MDREEPIIEDEMTEESMTDEELPTEESVLEEIIPDLTEEPDPFVQEMAANIADELDKEKEPPKEDPMDTLRNKYQDSAADNPLVEEVINGLTTFNEALDEIITEMYKVGDESSLREFVNCYATMSTLLGNSVLEDQERRDLYMFSLLHSVDASKKFRKGQLKFGVGSGVVLIAGEYLVRQSNYMQIGIILKSLGVGGVASTALAEVKYGLRGHKLGKKFSATREALYAAANALDLEVKELFRGD